MRSKINIPDIEVLRAEHEAALASMEQKSEAEIKREEWLKSRVGKFTSSELGRLMTYEDDIYELPKGALTYIEEKVLEIMTDGKSVNQYTNESMERGNEKELEAIEVFEKRFDVICYATGSDQQFIEFNSSFGGTPDGLIDTDDIAEVKCPNSKTHLFRINNIRNQEDFKKHEKGIYWQIQGNLLATGRKRCFFIDYDDRFIDPQLQLFVIQIHRNEYDIGKAIIRLDLAEKVKQQLLNIK